MLENLFRSHVAKLFTTESVRVLPPNHGDLTLYIAAGPALTDAIQNIETYGDFGSKIQTLVRHLLYIKFTDAGAKSIIFSAWADSLHSKSDIDLLKNLTKLNHSRRNGFER